MPAGIGIIAVFYNAQAQDNAHHHLIAVFIAVIQRLQTAPFSAWCVKSLARPVIVCRP